jgi:hypothetical protein
MFLFATVEMGQTIISKSDDYLKRLSSYEYSLKMNSNHIVGESEFIRYLISCVEPWSNEEITKFAVILDLIEEKVNKLGITFKNEIILVKTNGKDEWNSAYTRENAIFLPPYKINYTEEKLEKLILHELFHVLFRSRKEIQPLLYDFIGFTFTNEIKLPYSLENRKLTNPDGPVLNYCVEAKETEHSLYLCPLTMVREGRTAIDTTRDIMESIEFGFMEAEKKEGQWQIVLNNGKAVFWDPSGLEFPFCGIQDAGTLDPNEILAEAFTELALGDYNEQTFIDMSRFKEILCKSAQ